MIKVIYDFSTEKQVDAVVIPIMEDFIFENSYTRLIREQLCKVSDLNQLEKQFNNKGLLLGETSYHELENFDIFFKSFFLILVSVFENKTSFLELYKGVSKILEDSLNKNLKTIVIPPLYKNNFTIGTQYSIIIDAYVNLYKKNQDVASIELNIIGPKKNEDLEILYSVLKNVPQALWCKK